MPEIELTTMVMVTDKNTNRVLVQQRAKSWKGITFPGGHVENGESIVDAAIREVKEETGLTVSNLTPCGLIHWYNDKTHERYMVFQFKTETFCGELCSATDEGSVFWVAIEKLPALNLSKGFAERLPMFFEGNIAEGFAVWNDTYHGRLKWI